METRPTLVIAMKGDPCTGKTMLANSLAEHLKRPVLDLDDIRDSIASLLESTPTATTEYIDDQSFEAICQLAQPLIQAGIHVIIDSPLSRRWHLDRLLHVISTSPGSKLVIVECKPRDRFKWQTWVEERTTSSHSRDYCWYKPSKWDDLENLWEKDGGRSVYDNQDVPKLEINTAETFRLVSVAYAVEKLFESKRVYHIEFHDWNDKDAKGLIEDEGAGERTEPKLEELDPDNHFFHVHKLEKQLSVNENDQMTSCWGCLNPIAGPTAYKCKHCKLYLHLSCAELSSRKEFKPQDYPVFLREVPYKYLFQETIKCNYCDAHDRDLNECSECLFESFIRSKELPSILHHPCHEHPLTIWMVPISYKSDYTCEACGDIGENIAYYCIECMIYYHLTCSLLPHKFKQERHLHPLSITFLSEHAESEEEFLCDACETYRSPKTWIYYCRKCEFASHLRCMTFDC